MITEQVWNRYTKEEHQTWQTLYRRRMSVLENTASEAFLQGMQLIRLSSSEIPKISVINDSLKNLTGWQVVPVTGFLPAGEFFASLGTRRFPSTVTIRDNKHLDYIEAPDIFHDVFGHVPLHAHPIFADFLARFGRIAAQASNQNDIDRLARLFWFTVEFGLIREHDEIKIYGSGLISSHADAENALSDQCERLPFDVKMVLDQPFDIDQLQSRLFVIENFEQLTETLDLLERGNI